MSSFTLGRRRRARLFVVFPASLLASVVAAAPDSPSTGQRPASLTDAPVVVTATRQPFHIEEAPFAVEVYNRGDLDRSGAANFLDFLASQTSLTVLPGFGNPNQRLIDMRGFGLESGYQNVVISVDGYRLNDIDSATQFLGNIPLASIERVEIVRGAGGVTGGEGAMAGTINIVTREYNGASVRGHLGSNGQRAGTVSIGQSRERYSFSLDASHDERDGLAQRDNRGQRDENKLDTLNARGRFRPTDWLELRAGISGYDSLAIYREAIPRGLIDSRPTANAGAIGVYNRQDADSTRFTLGFLADLGGGFSLEYDHNGEDKTYAFSSPFAFVSDYRYESDRALLRWSEGRLSLVAGYDNLRGRRGGFAAIEKDTRGIFGQAVFRMGSTTLSGGLRRERIDYAYADSASRLADEERLTLWDAGINHRIDGRFNVFASYARGAQSPDIDRFFTFNSVTFEQTFNGLINPARSDTLSTGVRYAYDGTRLDVTGFYARVRDEIYGVAVAPPLFFVNTNLDRTHKYGAEVQWVQALGESLQGRLGYTWTQAVIDQESADPATGQPAIRNRDLPGVPRHGLTLSLDWRIDAATRLNVSHIYRSTAFAIGDFDNNGLRQRPYQFTNLLLSRQIDARWQAFAAIDNLFEERNGLYTAEGRSAFPSDYTRLWRFGLRAEF